MLPSIELADLATFSALTGAAPRPLLARLEAATGHALATFDGGVATLTPAGRLLAEHAAAIAAMLTAARDDLSAAIEGRARPRAVRVGGGPGVARTLLAAVVAEVARAEPGLAATPVPEATHADLEDRRVDVLLTHEPAGPHAECEPVMEDPWTLLVSSASPLARGRGDRTPTLAELAALPLIAPRSPGAVAAVRHALRALGAEPRFAMTIDDPPTVHALVAADLGGALLPRSAVDPWHLGTVTLSLTPLLPAQTLRLAWTTATPATTTPVRDATHATCARMAARTLSTAVPAAQR